MARLSELESSETEAGLRRFTLADIDDWDFPFSLQPIDGVRPDLEKK
jgi:hypothetical protein